MQRIPRYWLIYVYVQCVQKGQGQEDSGRLTSTFENSGWGNQLGVSSYNSSPAKPGSTLTDRALETMLAGFDRRHCLSFSKGLGLPMLQFPLLQNGEILPVIISPQSDVVIKMAMKAFCKIKKKKPTKRLLRRPAIYMWRLLERQRKLCD